MVDESQISGYLPVLELWGREQFLRLVSAAANAADSDKAECFQQLAAHASSYVAVIQGVELLREQRLDPSLSFERHVEVAIDILQRVLSVEALSTESRNAIVCWLADVQETMRRALGEEHNANG